jgi:hypothetical protein
MAARLEVGRNFFSNRVIDSWNQIPSRVKNVKRSTYGSGDETEKWRGQLNKNLPEREAPAGPLEQDTRIWIRFKGFKMTHLLLPCC